MNKRIVRIFLMTLLGILFLNVADVYASGSSYSRASIYLKSGSPTAGGKVYVGKAATSSPSYKNCTSTTSAASSAEVEGANKTTTYHFYAQANAGYKFTGWYTKNSNDEYTLASTEAHYSVAVTSGAAPSGMDNSYTDKNLYASFVKIIQLSFVTPTNGSYTITHDGAAVSDYASFTVDGTVKLQAFPDAGYRLKGWYTTTNGGATKSYFAFGDECEPNFTANTTIGAEFEPDDGKAQFWVQGTNYVTSNLAAANTKAESSSSKKIIVVNSGSIPTGTFTISSGVTLLIPYGSDYSKITEPNNVHITGIGSAPELKVYKKLTLAPGAIIDCSGSICVGGQVMAINGGNPTSLVRGSVGVLDLSLGGTINLKSGSTLYAWGFVQGQNMNQGNNTSNVGEIIAESGSNVYEVFQCGEWRGGTASQTIYNNRSSWKFFPFQSYTIQNIEAPITLKNGAKETCYWTIYGNGQTYTVKPDLIGSSGLFVLGTGASLKKWYDPTTDRVCYAMSGSASLGAISITLSGMTISSGDYNLPIPANMHIIVNSGTTTIGKPMVMHAGSVVEIKSDATLQLNSNCYMFDQTDWSTYCMYAYYFRNYANLTAHYDRDATYAGWNYSDGKVKTLLEDARLVVDGTLKFGSSGRLYSSTSGSAVVGNGGGQVQFGTLPTTTTIVMCKELSNNTSVSVSNANLCNDDGSYTKAIASTTFKNVNGRWFTSAASTIKSNHTYDFTYIKSGAVYGTGGTNTTVAAVYSHDKTGILDRMKWANVKADVCDNWWAGLNDTYLYNWTLHSAWHQFQPTGATIGEGDEVASIYSGSDNKLYTKLDCDIEEYGGTDANCLYTVGGVQKAFVNGALVALVKNTSDEAYHKSDAATTYYICFSEGCNWHPATKVASTNKAYTVDGQDYIWYDGAWLAATKDGTFYYSLDEHNVRIYYEYVSDVWTLASPVAETTRSGNTLSWFKIADAFSDANTGTGPGTATTIKLLKNVSVSTALNYTGDGNTILDLNGYTLTGTVTSMITLNAANAVLIVIDQSAAGTGKIQLSYSENSRRYAVSVTKGHFILNSGTVSAINTMTYNSSSAKTTDVGGVTVASGHKFTMNGGRLEAISDHNPYGVNIASSTTSVVTINGGTIEAKTTERSSSVDSPYGIYGYGKIIVNGGIIKATCYRSSSSRGISVLGSLEMKGGEVIASGTGTIYGVHVGTATTPTATITGGTITATATGGTVRGVISYGTTTISGGTINATAGTSDARGVFVYNTTTTINAGATINASANSDARVLYYGSGTPTVIVNGGTFNATTTSTTGAHGVYAEKGTGTINDGTFNVTAKTNTAYGMFVATANTPTLTVNGGKFKVASNAASPTGILLCNSDAATANFVINGGYYNLAKNENVTTGTEDGYTTYPNLSIAKYKASGKLVKELDATVEASLKTEGYGCKVTGKEYTVTWCKMGGNTGSNILKTEKWESGKVPVWTGPDPDLNSTGVTRVFAGWNTDTWNSGTAYPIGTPLPAITDHNVTYYAINRPIYAEVIADGKDSLFTSAQSAWKYAMKKTQATIRIKTQLGTEASVGNMTQMVFNPDNANSTITLDLNGLSWTMGNHKTNDVLDAENKNVFLSVAPEKENCKLIITDNSASGNGYLMNKHAYAGTLYCVDVAKGELILQGGGLRVSNTSDATAEKYGIGVDVASGAKFTMTGGTIYSTDVYSPRGMNVSSGGTADIAGGTIEANTTTGHAYAILPYGTVSVGGTALIKAVSTNAAAYAAQTQGTLNIDGGTFEATAASNARGLFAYVGGKITVDGNPTIKAEATSDSGESYPAYSHTSPSELVINGGSFTSTGTSNSGSIMGIRTVSKGVVTVNDGTFTLNGGKSWTFGAFTNGGTINLKGGTFNINQASGGNVEAVRVYPGGTCNISGGTYTVNATANTTNGNALCAFGGTANITGNPVFTAYKGIDIATAVVTNGDSTATVSVDGGTYITSSYALRSIKTTRADATYTGSITGDVTVWDGKFYSGTSEPVSTGSGTSYLKIRGGYYSTYTTDNVSNLTKYVVSPSTTEKKDTTIDGKAYTYRVNTKYTVTWKDKAGTTTVLTEEYNRNEMPTHAAYVPNDGNTYEFTGWNTATDGSGDTIQSVTSDITYYAQYTKYLAEVIEGEATSGTRYEKFSKAWAVAQNMPVATIKILSNFSSSLEYELKPDSASGAQSLTIDLNGHTITCSAATATAAFKIDKAGCKLIIDDSGSGGVLRHKANASATVLYGIKILNGELELKGGKLSAQNTCIDGVSGAGVRTVLGSAGTTFTMSGGTLLACSRLDPRAYASDGASVFNATGGTITARTDYIEDSTTKYGTNAYGVVLWNNGTFNMSGTTKITITTGTGALGVYSYGANAVANISGGTITATTKTGGSAVCTQAGNSGTLNITGGTFTARTAATWAVGVNSAEGGIVNVDGGTFDAQSTAADLTSIWNIEGIRVSKNANVVINGGNFTASKGASPIGVGVRGGTTTINGGTFDAKVGLYAMDYADGNQSATVTINGGTFIGTAEAVKVASMLRDVKDGEGNVTATYKAYSNVTVNGGYFYSEGSYIVSLTQKSGVTNSTLVLNGGKYCEKSGTTYKGQISALKGSTTTITDISETVGGKTYVYELKTPFSVTWNAGTSYTKSETLQSGVTPANTEVTSFVAADGKTYYFTGWSPTPAPIYDNTTYTAVGTYYEAKVKIGSGAWTNYEDFLDAWAVIQENANCTIALLNNVELADKILYKPEVANAKTTFDLNNFTLSAGGTVDRLLDFNKTDAQLTITDNSTAKGGKLSIVRTSASNIYTVVVSNGELLMTGGTLYVENNQNDANWHPAIAVYVAASDNAKLTMTGGTLESKAKYCAYTVQSYGITNITGGTVKANSPGLDDGSNGYAIGIYAVQRTTTIGDTAKIEATGLMSINGAMATGWISTDGQTRYNGTLNITGGTIDVTATAKNACGVQANATSKTVDGTNYGAHGIVNISGGTFNVKCSAATATQVFAMQVTAARIFDTATPHNLLLDEKAEANISGGTFLVDTRNNGAWVANGNNIDLLRNWGTLNVSGGTFTIYQNSSPVGVASYRNKATISGNPVFNINSYAAATGVEAGPWNSNGYCDADAANNLAEIEVNGGTFNVKTESNLSIGAWSCGGLDGDSKYAMNAKVTVNGGEFVCINPTAGYSRIFRQENTRTGTYGSATAQIIVRGGKFKPLFGTAEPYSSTGTHNVTLPDNNDKRTVLAGGYYVHNTELATFVSDTCVITPITSAAVDAEYNNGYRYRIDVNYVAKVQTGSTTKNYTTVKAAFDYAKTVSNPTITLLDNCTLSDGNYTFDANSWTGTLDLNNFTLTPTFDSSLGRAFTVKGTGSKLTITDNSSAKGGKIYYQGSSTMTVIYIVVEGSAEVELAGGTLYAENTSTDKQMNGFVVNGSGTKFTQSDGTFIVKGKYYGRGYYGSGTVELKGGKMNVTGETSQAIGLNPNTETSVLNISGTFALNAKSDNYAYGVYTQNGTATIEGTPALNVKAPTRARVLQGTGGSTTVNGGLFEANGTTESQSDCYALISEGTSTMTVGGGKFKTNQNNIAYKSTDATLTINGGYFNESSGTTHKTQVETYKGSGKEVMTLDSDEAEYIAGYRYLVTADPVAKVKAGSEITYHTTIADAIAAANELTDPTVTMLKDVTTTQVGITATMIIDLNGKTISSTQTKASRGVLLINEDDITVTIRDSGTGGKIDHTASVEGYLYGVSVAAGTLNLEGGTIYAKNTAAKDTSTVRACGIYSVASTAITISEGRVEAWRPEKTYAWGIYASGDITMTGGTVYAEGSGVVRGIYTYVATAPALTASLTNATVTATASETNSMAVYAYANTDLTIHSGTYTATGTTTVYAVYERNEDSNTVTINGGKFSGTTGELFKGTKATASIRGGYYVHNTSIEANCAANYHILQLPTPLTEGGITYQYEVAEAYTLTWDLDGGTVTTAGTQATVDATGTPSGYVKKGASLTAPTVTKTGYTFASWSPAVAATMPTANTTYTATWNINTFAITWKNGSTIIETDAAVNYGATPSYDGATPTKTADATYVYTFDGWSTTDGGALVSPLPAVTAAATYYAHYSTAPTVASVTINGATTYHATLADAFTKANSATKAPTITILQDILGLTSGVSYTNTSYNGTLDLNNHTVAGTVMNVITMNASGKKLTITDTSGAKGGELRTVVNTNALVCAVSVARGTLQINEGKVYAENTNTGSSAFATAVNVSSNASRVDVNGGTLEAKAVKDSYGIYSCSTVDVNGGTVKATTTGATGTTAYGMYVANEFLTIPEGADVDVIVSGAYDAVGVFVGGINAGGDDSDGYAQINTINLSVTATNTAYGFWSNADENGGSANAGNIQVEDGVINITGNKAVGVHVSAGADGEEPEMFIYGGKYKLTGTTKQFLSYQSTTDASNYYVTGGYFNINIDGGGDDTQYIPSPKHVVPTTAAERASIGEDYLYKVTDAYTVTWVTDGDALTGDYTAGITAVGATIVQPNTPTKAGYTFNAWSPVPGATMTASNKTYTATWNAAVASVAAEGETTTYYATVASAIAAANELTNPTVTMLRDASVTAQVDITATMTIDLNGKTVSSASTTKKNGVFIVNADGITVTIKDSGTGGKIDHTASIASNVYGLYVAKGSLILESGTVYAKNTATASDGAFGINATGNVTVTGGTVYAEGTTAVYGIYNTVSTTLTNATVTAKSNITDGSAGTVYALTAKGGTLTVNSGTYTATGGKTGYTVVASNTEGVSVTINGGKFSGTSRELYKGTSATASISGGYYVHNTTVKDNCATNYHVLPASLTEGGITYNYEVAEAYKLTWSTDGDDLTGDYTKGYNGYVKPGTTIVAPNTPTKSGYTFAAWTPAVAATMPAANTTYTATWTINQYTVTWDATTNGGSCTVPSTTKDYNTAIGTLPTATKTGYDFNGWFTAATGGEQITTATKVTADVTYYAQFSVRSHTLTWNANGGTLTGGTASGTYAYGTAITAPTATRDGYTFAGWYFERMSEVQTPKTTMQDYDMVYTAQWTMVNYNITYDLDGGTAGTPANPTTYNIESAAITLSNPTKAGYTFTGWTGTGLSDATETVTIPAGSTGNRTYTATWAQNVASVTVSGTTTPYTTLADAFKAANEAAAAPTIKILQDISGITETLTYSGAKNCTLDLNGHTVESTARYMLYMSPSTNAPILTITDLTSQKEGKLWQNPSTTSTSYTVYIAKGKVVFEAGTIGGESSTATLVGVQVTNSTSRSFTMNGGKIEITTTNSKIGYGIITYGIVNINSGKIDVQTAGAAYGVECRNNTTTIKAPADFYIRGTTAYGARVGGHTPTATASYNGTLNVEGGTFDVEASTGNAYGVDVYSGTFTATDETVYHDAGTANISGGTFTVNAKTTDKYAFGVQVLAALTDPVATPKATITGGKFNVTAATAARAYATNTKAAATALLVQGGWYNIDKGLANYIAPTKTTSNYYKFSLAGQSPYKYEVAEGYTLTWDLDGGSVSAAGTPDGVVKVGASLTAPTVTKTDYTFAGWTPAPAAIMPAEDQTYTATWTLDETGSLLDIVDWTANTLTINANGWTASGWPYTINGVVYQKDKATADAISSANYRDADRTLVLSYSGDAGTQLSIKVQDKDNTVISLKKYTIPFIGTTAGTDASSIVYVNSGTLTISANTTLAALYIRPEASVTITGGTLTIGKLVLRTLPWQAAAISGNFTATETWYTRIAPNKRTVTGPYAPITYESASYYQFALPRNCTAKLKDIKVSHGANTPYGNTWLLKRYNEATRAANGAGNDNWVALGENDYIQGGVGYEMFSNSAYYREFYFPLGTVSSASLGTTTSVAYDLGAAGDKHAGWNIVSSPLMSVYDNSKANPETGMKVSWLMTDGSYDQGIPEAIYPAIPFSYQASEGQSSISFAGASLVAAVPQRRVAAEDEPVRLQWLHLDVQDENGIGDHTSILSHPERYEEAYKTGIDVAKQSFEASRALLYSSHAYGEMAFAGVADSLLERGIPLTVFSPAAQKLTFSLRENDWLDRMAYVWLMDNETGVRTDLLNSAYTYDAAEGTTRGRFVLFGKFNAPQIPTGTGEVQDGNAQGVKAQKVLMDGKMYIRIGNRTYDATGKLVTK